MNRLLSLMAFALAAHSLNAQPQYCTINFTAKLQTSLSVSTVKSPVYNNVNNQCTNWAVSVSFPSQVVNPTLTFAGSWDQAGSPGTFAPLPPNCIAGGSLSSAVGGSPASQAVVNPMIFTGNGGWGDVVFNNCYFPYLQLSISASSFPGTGTFSVPVRASGSAGINPVAAVFAQAAPPSGGGSAGCGYVQSAAAPWFASPTGSRVPNLTVYTNGTGKPVCVSIVNVALATGEEITAFCDNNPTNPTTLVARTINNAPNVEVRSIFFVVPPGFHYAVTSQALTIPGQGSWIEWN